MHSQKVLWIFDRHVLSNILPNLAHFLPTYLHWYSIKIQSTDFTRDYSIVVLKGLKSIPGTLTLRHLHGTHSAEAFATDAQGQHPVSLETLRSIKPEIRWLLDRTLSLSLQTSLSEPGTHIRMLTPEQSDAALLLRLYKTLLD